MADTRQYFKSPDLFTLIIGHEKSELYVPRTLLEQIPFFSNALKGDQFKEATEKVFEMPEDDPKTINDLLHFVFADHVKSIQETSKEKTTDEEAEIVKSYVRAFIAADKFMAEGTANRIVDSLFNYHLTTGVDPELIGILSSANLRDTGLYKYLLDDIVMGMINAAKKDEPFREDQWVNENEGYPFIGLGEADAMALLRGLSFSAVGEDTWEKCDLHTHKVTPRCHDEFSDDDAGGAE